MDSVVNWISNLKGKGGEGTINYDNWRHLYLNQGLSILWGGKLQVFSASSGVYQGENI